MNGRCHHTTLRSLVIDALRMADVATVRVFVDVIDKENTERRASGGAPLDNYNLHPGDCRCAYHDGNG